MNSAINEYTTQSPINSGTQQPRRHLLASVLAIGLIAGSFGLVGCNNNTADNNITETIDPSGGKSESTVQDKDKQSDKSTETVPETVLSETNNSGVPVRYNVAAWNKTKVDSVEIDELDKIQRNFGKVVTTDEHSLDYASNPATKYRFMKDDAAYLDLIDSQKYLELGWYYANPTDTEAEKAISTAHAKKAYTFARQLMGQEGGKIVADILGGQIIKSKEAGGMKVELAKCEFYSCMLIIAKPSA